MLKVINNLPNLIPNLSKLEKRMGEQTVAKLSITPKYSFNIASNISEYSFNTKPRTMEDYRRIKEEGKYELLTEDDMKWIDDNVREDGNLY